jgi:hypothetical protein
MEAMLKPGLVELSTPNHGLITGWRILGILSILLNKTSTQAA